MRTLEPSTPPPPPPAGPYSSGTPRGANGNGPYGPSSPPAGSGASTGGVIGGSAPGFNGPGFNGTPAPGFAASPPGVAPMRQPIDQIPVAAGSRPPPVKPYIPKSVSLFDAMKFNGPAPELINGRLAMVGILAAAMKEVQSAIPVEQQAVVAAEGPGVFLLALIVYASLVPILKAAKSEPFGIFTPTAEVTNGRAAMLGFATLLLLEHKSGVCFF